MKKSVVILSQVSIALCFMLCTFSLQAQKTNLWKGGKSGNSQNWNYAQNWSLNTVPNEFHDVIIPDVSTGSNQYPVLSNDEFVIRSLMVCSNARLTVESAATLRVEGYGDYSGFINLGKIIGCDRIISPMSPANNITASIANKQP